MEILVLWAVFAAVVSWWAERLGRSGWVALALAVVLSPLVAGLVYLILGPSEAERRRRILAEERLRAEVRREMVGKDAPQRRGWPPRTGPVDRDPYG